jgi:inner membrane transporter RhtA
MAGVLSSVVPHAADLTALRFVPPRFFGVVRSAHPVMAALAGLAILGQVLALHEWFGIAIVVAVNALAVACALRAVGQAGEATHRNALTSTHPPRSSARRWVQPSAARPNASQWVPCAESLEGEPAALAKG